MFSRPRSLSTRPTNQSDAGSIAVEFLICGLLAPTLVTGAVLTLAAEQRDHMAAQQLAREYVRAASVGAGESVAAVMSALVANDLNLTDSQVRVSAVELKGEVVQATAIVSGAVEIARMRKQP